MNLATSFTTPCRETAGVSAKVSARDISRDIVSRAQRHVRNRATNQAGMARLAQVSIDAIARHVDVDKDTVYRWINHRGMPAHKVGRQWKFRILQIDEWVQAGNVAEGNKGE